MPKINVVTAADTGPGAPPPNQQGDATATDPLGLSVGQDIDWTIDSGGGPPPDPPPTGGAKRWNPGHYLKLSGDPSDGDNGGNDYWDKVTQQMQSQFPGSEYIGIHIGVSWGTVNPTGNTFDFTRMDQFHSDMLAIKPDAKIIWQLSWKAYANRPNPELIIPQDLITAGDFTETSTGWYGWVHLQSNMDRCIAAFEAINNEYDDQSFYEGLATDESNPSLGGAPGGTPTGYTVIAMKDQLIRLYAAMGASGVHSNSFGNMNSLGQGTQIQIDVLMEECYNLRIGIAGPDAREVQAFQMYEGTHAEAVRDYRLQIPCMMTASFSAFGFQCEVRSSSQIIDLMQTHKTTHMTWVTSQSCESSAQIEASIAADPLLSITCPLRYVSCDVS